MFRSSFFRGWLLSSYFSRTFHSAFGLYESRKNSFFPRYFSENILENIYIFEREKTKSKRIFLGFPLRRKREERIIRSHFVSVSFRYSYRLSGRQVSPLPVCLVFDLLFCIRNVMISFAPTFFVSFGARIECKKKKPTSQQLPRHRLPSRRLRRLQ